MLNKSFDIIIRKYFLKVNPNSEIFYTGLLLSKLLFMNQTTGIGCFIILIKIGSDRGSNDSYN
jgi:hypothetical protein